MLAADPPVGAEAVGENLASENRLLQWDCFVGPQTVRRLVKALGCADEQRGEVVASRSRYDRALGAVATKRLDDANRELLALEEELEPALVDDRAFEELLPPARVHMRRLRERHAAGELVLERFSPGFMEGHNVIAGRTTALLWRSEQEFREVFVVEVLKLLAIDDARIGATVRARVLNDAIGEAAIMKGISGAEGPVLSFDFHGALFDFASTFGPLEAIMGASESLHDVGNGNGAAAAQALQRVILEGDARVAVRIEEWLTARIEMEKEMPSDRGAQGEMMRMFRHMDACTRAVARARWESANEISGVLLAHFGGDVAEGWRVAFAKKFCPGAFKPDPFADGFAVIEARLVGAPQRTTELAQIRDEYLAARAAYRLRFCEGSLDDTSMSGGLIQNGRTTEVRQDINALQNRVITDLSSFLGPDEKDLLSSMNVAEFGRPIR